MPSIARNHTPRSLLQPLSSFKDSRLVFSPHGDHWAIVSPYPHSCWPARSSAMTPPTPASVDDMFSFIHKQPCRKRVDSDPPVTFAALVLLQRLKACFLTTQGLSGHRLSVSAFMLASKVICDDTPYSRQRQRHVLVYPQAALPQTSR